MILDTTSKILELTTGANVSTDYYVSYVDITTTSLTPGSNQGNVATAATTTIVSAPSASTQRHIKFLSIRNRSTTTSQTINIKLDVSGTEYRLTADITLAAGEVLEYTESTGFNTITSAGGRKLVSQNKAAADGRNFAFMKVGTASEAAGVWYTHAKDAGDPGFWRWYIGTTGMNGRATNGPTESGSLLYQNASGGNNYLTSFTVSSSTAHAHFLFDVLWINTGINTTTGVAQTVNSVSWPARDLNGTTGGYGVWLGLLVHTATTNVAAMTNAIATYTNSDGIANRTGIIANFPATAVANTVLWYNLTGGDRGVQSVQSIQFTTLPSGGPISLIAAVPIAAASMQLANIGSNAQLDPNAGVRLYDGTCLIPMYISSATTATNTVGTYTISTR